ncbi:MAG: hypothetical protein J6X94_14345 [Lachnospiraceae bacterium]|nr:hypothetical protein [Lachnospiraceae bacterium]
MKLFKDKVEVNFRHSLYLSDSISLNKLPKVKDKILKGKGSYKLILVSEKEDENFDIVSVSNLKSRVWEGKVPQVCGVADNEDEAFKLVAKITEDCLKNRGNLELKEYICSL